MRSRFNSGVLFIIAVLLVAGSIAVWELYKLQQQASGEMLTQIHRSVSTIVIGTGVCVSMLLMLMLFFNLYYLRPVKRINRALKYYLTAHTPFNPAFEAGRELSDLKEMIERLVEQNKRSHKS